MNEETPKIERQDVVGQRFVWHDGTSACGAGDLLCAITVLSESQLPDNYIDNQTVTDYLKDKGLIEQTGECRFRAVKEKHEELVALGDNVSSAIGSEIENLPVDTKITLAPAIHLVPQGGSSLFTKNE